MGIVINLRKINHNFLNGSIKFPRSPQSTISLTYLSSDPFHISTLFMFYLSTGHHNFSFQNLKWLIFFFLINESG